MVVRSLIYKEWSEQGWKLLFGCVVLMAFAAIGLRTRLAEDRLILQAAVAMGAFILPLFVGMGVVATDRAHGSLGTLLALPVRAGWVLAAKIAVAAAACVAPLAGVGLVTWLIAGQREVAAADTARMLAVGAAAGVMVMLWTVTLGARQSTEARAAMLGMAFLAVGFASLRLIYMVRVWWHPTVETYASLPAPAWLMRALLLHPVALIWPPHGWQEDAAPLVAAGLVVQVAVAVVLCVIAARRLAPADGARS